MDPPAIPKKRIPNFTADEKLLLANLVKKYNIIENKQSDGKNVAKKLVAWQQLTKEFNSNLNVHKRETASLRKAWDNLKTSARRAKAEQRASYIRTGGGPPPPPPPPQQGALHEVVEAAAPAMICEITNSFDSDEIMITVPELELTFPNPTPAPAAAPAAAPDVQDIDNSSELFETGSQLEVQTGNQGKKPSDYIKREAILRIRHFEQKKKLEIQILKSQLKVEQIKIKSALLEEEKNKIVLQKALLELEMFKKNIAGAPE